MPYPERFDSTGVLRGRLVNLDGRVELVLCGELDASNAERLTERLRELADASGGDVVVDVAEVGFIDSSGLRALLAVHFAMAEGTRLVFVNPGSALLRILELTGVGDALHLE